MPAGRPTKYNSEIAALLCARIAEGHSLRSICLLDDMPSLQTHFVWLSKHPEFVDQYTKAKVESGHADADKIERIAERVLDGEVDANAARVAIDAYKWTASKKVPKKYGAVVTNVNLNHDMTDMSDEELDRLLAERESAAERSTKD